LVTDPEEPTFSFITPGEERRATGRKLGYFKPLLMDVPRSQPGDPAVMEFSVRSASGLDLPEDPNVVTIFLEGLWGEALKCLKNPKSVYGWPERSEGLPHVVVAYPSNWNPTEVERLKAAVRGAKIDQQACQSCGVMYCTEQEAAVHAAMVDHKQLLEAHYQVSKLPSLILLVRTN
jgi:hypothetical protein